MIDCVETMSLITGIFSDSSERNSVDTLCRLCMKNNDNYYDIFSSNLASKMTVKDALNDLVGLQVAVEDGLPANMCPLCLKKLKEFSDFKRICLESDEELRKCSSRNYFRQRGNEEGAADVKLESCDDTTDCIQDATQGTSRVECSVQTTEVYIPVTSCQSPRANMLLHVKEEDEDPLREGDYPIGHTTAPGGISSNVLDPLATHELKNRVMAVQTGRKRTQSQILHMNTGKGQRKKQGRDEENNEISRLRIQEGEERIAELKKEREEYKAQFLQLSSNLAEIVKVNLEMHKMLAENHGSVSRGSAQTNGSCVVLPTGNISNVISISGAALQGKEVPMEVLSLPFNDDDEFDLAEPRVEIIENAERIHGCVANNASKEPEVGSLSDDKTEIYMGHNVWLSTERWNGVRSNTDDSKFVKDLAFAIYGQKLENMSVTGRKCPWKDIPPKEAMNPSKLAVIKDFYLRKVQKDNNMFSLLCKRKDGNLMVDEKKVNRNICQWIGEKSANLAKRKKAV
ncbi:uncharacterized protein LOC124170210 isoform X3 [Ischnura elegans]|uniref:uncharacterized protein LOC124170210 isoform X3 n=1 Tax=Ischnura elegans TaxID=197161 RepID=UPI001ED87592|nr:uncharacterized protein LOC124170210 isoform X3 [Ischnura elegans]